MAERKLNERLKALIDHDVIVYMLGDPQDSDGTPNGLPPGRVREVGYDYPLLQTESEDDGGFTETGGEYIVSLQYLTSIIHMVPECAGCAVELAGNLTPEPPST